MQEFNYHRGQITRWKELLNLVKYVIGEETINKLNFIEDIKQNH